MDDNVHYLREPLDTTKHYSCYFCEEEVEFNEPLEDWQHTSTGDSVCGTKATPSNLEVPNE